MNYKFGSLKKVLDLLNQEGELSAGKISEKLSMSRVIIHKYLKALHDQGKIQKLGTSPHTKYSVNSQLKKSIQQSEDRDIVVSFEMRKLIEDNFFKFSPNGEMLRGFGGMQKWCKERDLPFEKTLNQYQKIQKYIFSLQDICGMLSADLSFGEHFEEKYLNDVFFADQYIYGQFGRGKLAEIAFYAKQSQNKNLISETISYFLPKLECLVAREKFDAIAIAPWSVKRENQILGALKKDLQAFNLPFINVIKYSSSGIFIPQKSLKKSSERIENARNTIFIDDVNIKNYQRVLLIDDFVGSGATLNETAKKLKDEGVTHVTGFAFVGNTDLSYDVINEI